MRERLLMVRVREQPPARYNAVGFDPQGRDDVSPENRESGTRYYGNAGQQQPLYAARSAPLPGLNDVT